MLSVVYELNNLPNVFGENFCLLAGHFLTKVMVLNWFGWVICLVYTEWWIFCWTNEWLNWDFFLLTEDLNMPVLLQFLVVLKGSDFDKEWEVVLCSEFVSVELRFLFLNYTYTLCLEVYCFGLEIWLLLDSNMLHFEWRKWEDSRDVLCALILNALNMLICSHILLLAMDKSMLT